MFGETFTSELFEIVCVLVVIFRPKSFSSVAVVQLFFVGEYPTSQNIDTYMMKLKQLVTENPSSKDLIAVRMALSEVNFM